MVSHVKALRVQLSDIKPYSHEVTVNNSHLDRELALSRAWLGEFLKECEEPYPYERDESRKEVKDIKPPTDVVESPHTFNIRYICQNSEVRIMLNSIADSIRQIVNNGLMDSWKYVCLINAYSHVSNARITLGYILGEIKDSSGS